ncbi:MAG: hypothetical protein EOO65_04970, partial [Methanosarcinales archaeon]
MAAISGGDGLRGKRNVLGCVVAVGEKSRGTLVFLPFACVVLYIADSNNHCIRRVDESGIISSVAGNGISGFSGDGSAATAAMLKNPSGVSALTNSTTGGVVLYIADNNNHRIRRVDEAGNISSVAGTGTAGFSGDGGPATAAMLKNPNGVAVWYSANSDGVVLYIADSNNNRIRRVNEAGNIDSVAGTSTSGYSGDGGPATAAKLSSPYGVSALYNASSGGVALWIADFS